MNVFPLYNGVTVSLYLWGIGSKVLGGDFLSSEVAVDVNLKNRFFPIVELGYGSTDAWNDNGTNYKSNAPYFRIGMNYNALYKKKKRDEAIKANNQFVEKKIDEKPIERIKDKPFLT